MPRPDIAPMNLPAKRDLDRELISRVAMDIGKEMVVYLEIQYLEVFKVMDGGCRLSVRNHIHNDIMAALDTTNADEIEARLKTRRARRRKLLAQWREIRKPRKVR